MRSFGIVVNVVNVKLTFKAITDYCTVYSIYAERAGYVDSEGIKAAEPNGYSKKKTKKNHS